MNQDQLELLQSKLAQPQNIIIVPHKSPDGDAVGSITAMYGYLTQLGHEVSMISPNDFPDFLRWIPHADKILNYEMQRDTADPIIENVDIVFIMDHNALHRAGALEEPLSDSDAFFVMVDHHQQPDDIAQVTYSDVTMSSTCEMVYHLLDKLEHTDKIDKDIASSLYTGILTDTGSFKYRSTTATTLRVAANLVDKGADSEKINRRIYDVNKPSRMRLLGVALKNLVVLEKYRTAYITLTQQELDDAGFQKGDTEGFVNYALSLDGIVFAQIFIEKEDEGIIKTSLRSKGDFDVNTMAREHWNGGGHRNAAGGRSEMPMDQTVDKLNRILPDYEKKLQETEI
jgi:phosphoesterase RecJ-like protein